MLCNGPKAEYIGNLLSCPVLEGLPDLFLIDLQDIGEVDLQAYHCGWQGCSSQATVKTALPGTVPLVTDGVGNVEVVQRSRAAPGNGAGVMYVEWFPGADHAAGGSVPAG